MPPEKKSLSLAETLGYYAYVVMTLGVAWLIKIVIKKAIIEAER